MSLLDKIKRSSGLEGTKGIKQSLGEHTGFTNAADSFQRAKEGNTAGFLADPAGVFGSSIQENKNFIKLADPANLTGSRPGAVEETGLTVEELIAQRTPEALGLLQEGSAAALDRSRQGQQIATSGLDQFGDLRAFDEQQALIGTRGEAAQEAAIGNIPISQFNQQLNARQQERQKRQASARNELGSGATILEAQQLGGAQVAQNIARRLSELEPLVGVARGARSTQSTIDEASRARQAGLQTGLGTQQANIRLGTTAPLIESRQSQAELSGLKGIAAADQRGQIASQLTELAGQFTSSTPPPSSDQFFNQQEGFGNIGDPFSATPPPNRDFRR